jgi:hypothetical protein
VPNKHDPTATAPVLSTAETEVHALFVAETALTHHQCYCKSNGKISRLNENKRNMATCSTILVRKFKRGLYLLIFVHE